MHVLTRFDIRRTLLSCRNLGQYTAVASEAISPLAAAIFSWRGHHSTQAAQSSLIKGLRETRWRSRQEILAGPEGFLGLKLRNFLRLDYGLQTTLPWCLVAIFLTLCSNHVIPGLHFLNNLGGLVHFFSIKLLHLRRKTWRFQIGRWANDTPILLRWSAF